MARSVCAMTRADNKWERVRRLRSGHVTKLILARYGTAGVPDDDAGRPDLMELLYLASQAPAGAEKKIRHAIELYAPWMQEEEAEALMQHIATTPDYQKARTSGELGEALHLTRDERERWKLWSIRPCDVTEAEFLAQSKTRSENRRAAKRRQSGVKPRAQYLAELRRKPKPWDGSGLSRWQWYRRNKVVSDSRRGVVETIVIEAEPHPVAEQGEALKSPQGKGVELQSKHGKEKQVESDEQGASHANDTPVAEEHPLIAAMQNWGANLERKKNSTISAKKKSAVGMTSPNSRRSRPILLGVPWRPCLVTFPLK